jgi:hypothetical protein
VHGPAAYDASEPGRRRARRCVYKREEEEGMKTEETGRGRNSGDIPSAEGNIGGNRLGRDLCEAYALCC